VPRCKRRKPKFDLQVKLKTISQNPQISGTVRFVFLGVLCGLFSSFAVKTLSYAAKDPPAQKVPKKNYFRFAPTCSRNPASLASFAALSVASQVKSASSRPK
jgi:hypothetical protein